MSIDFRFKCRTCLSVSTSYQQLCEYVDDKYKIIEMLDGIVPQINIKSSTRFSTLMCQICVDRLLIGYKFQQMCIETNNRLHGLLHIPFFEIEPEKTGESNLTVIQEIEENLNTECEIVELDRGIKLGNDNASDGEGGTANEEKEEYFKQAISYRCSDCFKCFKTEALLSAHHEQHKPNDLRTIAKSKTFQPGENEEADSSKQLEKLTVEPIEIIPKTIVKEEIDITSQMLDEVVNDSIEREFLSNDDEDSNYNSKKNLCTKLDAEGVNETESSQNKGFSCKTCGKTFKKHSYLKRHSSVVHSSTREVERPQNIGKGNYSCEKCGKVFCYPYLLQRHSVLHSLKKPFECNICKYRFHSNSTLKAHLTMHKYEKNSKELHPEGFKCPDCPRRFQKKSSLAAHRHVHVRNTLELKYPCEVCQRYFTSIRNLTVHIEIKHPESERYKCEHCDKTFPVRISLLEHLSSNKGDDKIRCTVCKTDFPCKSKLNDHTPSCRYICAQCGKKCYKASNLRLHMQVHKFEIHDPLEEEDS